MWDAHKDAPHPEMHENSLKTHYIRSEFFLRGLNRYKEHTSNALKIIGSQDRISGDEYGLDFTITKVSSSFIEAGNAQAVIRAKYPPENRSLLNSLPFHSPAPDDIFIKVLKPTPIINHDQSIDFLEPRTYDARVNAWELSPLDNAVLNWFVRFDGAGGEHLWLDDEQFGIRFKDGFFVAFGCGINGMLTHVLGETLPDESREWAGIRGTEVIDISNTSDADLDRLEQQYLSSAVEQEAGRALGWLSWIYHPTQGAYPDIARYKKYRELGFFNG